MVRSHAKSALNRVLSLDTIFSYRECSHSFK